MGVARMKRTPLARTKPLVSKILPRQTVTLKTRAPMRTRAPKSTPARRAAKGQPCLLNVAGVCNYNAETTVLAHLRWLGNCGTGIKPPDACAVRSCSACHDWLDGRTKPLHPDTYESDKNFYAARALVRMRELDMENAA
jgi:hypothetical protein